MSQGKAIDVREGKQSACNVYIKLKNGNVYRYPKPLDEPEKKKLIAGIESRNGKVQLKHWELAKKKSS